MNSGSMTYIVSAKAEITPQTACLENIDLNKPITLSFERDLLIDFLISRTGLSHIVLFITKKTSNDSRANR